MSNSYKLICIISICYIGFASLFLLWHRMWFSPDQFFGVALIGMLIIGRFRQFIQDWSFPTLLFLGYEYLRSLIPILSLKAHVLLMINFDKALFGSIPTIYLQHQLFSDGKIHWYDYVAVVLYISHFIVPMLVGFTFWLVKKETFKEYFLALLILSYMAFVTYIVFPAVPPWMASRDGFLPSLVQIMDKVFESFAQPITLPTIYQFFGANLVAAVPSLHAAFPWLTFLFMVRRLKLWGIAFLPYVFGVWFAVVYLGEHYVFDIVIAIIYATAAFFVVIKRKLLLRHARNFFTFPKRKLRLGYSTKRSDIRGNH